MVCGSEATSDGRSDAGAGSGDGDEWLQGTSALGVEPMAARPDGSTFASAARRGRFDCSEWPKCRLEFATRLTDLHDSTFTRTGTYPPLPPFRRITRSMGVCSLTWASSRPVAVGVAGPHPSSPSASRLAPSASVTVEDAGVMVRLGPVDAHGLRRTSPPSGRCGARSAPCTPISARVRVFCAWPLTRVLLGPRR